MWRRPRQVSEGSSLHPDPPPCRSCQLPRLPGWRSRCRQSAWTACPCVAAPAGAGKLPRARPDPRSCRRGGGGLGVGTSKAERRPRGSQHISVRMAQRHKQRGAAARQRRASHDCKQRMPRGWACRGQGGRHGGRRMPGGWAGGTGGTAGSALEVHGHQVQLLVILFLAHGEGPLLQVRPHDLRRGRECMERGGARLAWVVSGGRSTSAGGQTRGTARSHGRATKPACGTGGAGSGCTR